MTSEQCRRYLEDPDANAEHLAECSECRAMHDELAAKVAAQPIRVDALPLAPWEGATHRSWPLVLGAALTVIAIAAGLFAAAGASPLIAIGEAVREAVPSAGLMLGVLRMMGGAAPIAILLSFVAVNAILFLLLRRAPKGIDV